MARVPLTAGAHVPGLSIALIRNARVAWGRGFGMTDPVSNAPVSTETRFEAGSVSKTVFAYAVMKLAEKAVLNLDTQEQSWRHPAPGSCHCRRWCSS